MSKEWISVEKELPISSSNDPLFDAPFHEEDVQVRLANGKIRRCNFWCCWDCGIEDDDSEFIREFDIEDKVTHWRRLS